MCLTAKKWSHHYRGIILDGLADQLEEDSLRRCLHCTQVSYPSEWHLSLSTWLSFTWVWAFPLPRPTWVTVSYFCIHTMCVWGHIPYFCAEMLLDSFPVKCVNCRITCLFLRAKCGKALGSYQHTSNFLPSKVGRLHPEWKWNQVSNLHSQMGKQQRSGYLCRYILMSQR